MRLDTTDLINYFANARWKLQWFSKCSLRNQGTLQSQGPSSRPYGTPKGLVAPGIFPEQLRQLLTTSTFYFVDRQRARKRPITSRWVFKAKKNPQGLIH